MYTPAHHSSSNINDAFELMDHNPFATLVTVVNGKPAITHLPLTPQKVGDKIELIGHLARANPHWKSLASSHSTVIFQGPHAYITPTWYGEDDVPTWNYSTVHAIGPVELIEDYKGIIDCLKKLTAHAERHWPSGWEFFIPEELSGEHLAKSIVGFRIKVEEINFKKKLSQNRSISDLEGILRGLEARGDESSRLVLKDMKKLISKD